MTGDRSQRLTEPRRLWLAAEYLALFVAAPTLFATQRLPVPIFGALWLTSAACLAALLANRDFERRRLWNVEALPRTLPLALGPFLVAAPLLLLLAWWLDPAGLFAFVKRRPQLWALVMVLYPALSAFPQGIIYRDFVFHRYRRLFPGRWSLIVASAVAFCWVHVIFQNWVAPPLSLAGGLLFAWTYERTRSTLVATIQHAAFGCWVFTVGLGWYFYYGSVAG